MTGIRVTFESAANGYSLSLRTFVDTTQTGSSMASSVDQKLLKATKFPPDFNQKVDMKKVNIEVMKK